MRLDAYMREHKLTQAALGAMLNPPVSQSQVSQWFRGRTSITLEQALQIVQITNGAVTAADCARVHLPDDSAEAGDAQHKPQSETAQVPA